MADGLWNLCDLSLKHFYPYFNPYPPSAAYMHKRGRSAFVQTMACCLFGTKPLAEPLLDYCQLDSGEQVLVKLGRNSHFQENAFQKCCLSKRRPFFQGDMSLSEEEKRSRANTVVFPVSAAGRWEITRARQHWTHIRRGGWSNPLCYGPLPRPVHLLWGLPYAGILLIHMQTPLLWRLLTRIRT